MHRSDKIPIEDRNRMIFDLSILPAGQERACMVGIDRVARVVEVRGFVP